MLTKLLKVSDVEAIDATAEKSEEVFEMVAQASFITSLVTSFVLFCILIVAYAILSRRPANAVIYYPLRILRGEDGAALAKRRGPLAWIVDSYRATEDDIVAAAGLDAAVYMHLFTAALEIIILSSVYCVPVLISLSATSKYNQEQSIKDANFTSTKFDNLGMGNVEPNSNKIWAFLIGMFWVSVVTYFVLWRSFRLVVDMRDREQASAYARPQQFTVLVRDIPRLKDKQTRIQQVEHFFARTHPNAYNRVQLVHNVKKVEKLFSEREEALRALEHAEGVWELSKTKKTKKEGGEDGANIEDGVNSKPRVDGEGGTNRESPAGDKADAGGVGGAEGEGGANVEAGAEGEGGANVEADAGGEGERPMHKTGFMGLWGPKVDSIDYWRAKCEELRPEVQAEQKRTLEDCEQDVAFVIFNDRRSATEASQVVHAPHALKWKVTQAPEPEEMCWGSLSVRAWDRATRRTLVNVLTFFLVIFYMIPIAFVASLTTLENLEKLLPFVRSIQRIPILSDAISAYLPQVALLLFLALLPKLMLFLSQFEGFASQAQVVRSASAKYFYFIIFNVFLGVTIFGAVFSNLASVKVLVNQSQLSASRVVQLFGSKLPPVASYYITYVALKFFIGYGLELSRVVPLLLFTFKRKFKCKTDREMNEAWAPGPFTYHKSIASDLLIFTLCLCYAVIAPMILPFAFLYYALGWLVMRNQALNVHVPEFESHGSMWPHIHNRILAALLVAQITALGYFGVKEFPYTPILVVLPVSTAVFYVFCLNNYYPSIAVVSLWVAAEEPKAKPSYDAIIEAYTPPCLQADHPGIRDRRSNLATRLDATIDSVL